MEHAFFKVGDIISDKQEYPAGLGSCIGSKALVLQIEPPEYPHDEGYMKYLTLEVDPNEVFARDEKGVSREARAEDGDNTYTYAKVGDFQDAHVWHPTHPYYNHEEKVEVIEHSEFYATLLKPRYHVGNGVICYHGEHAGKQGVVIAYEAPEPMNSQREMAEEPLNCYTGWVLWTTATETILSIVYHPLTPDFGLLDEAPSLTGGHFPKTEARTEPRCSVNCLLEVLSFNEGEIVEVEIGKGKALGVILSMTDNELGDWHPLRTYTYDIKVLHTEGIVDAKDGSRVKPMDVVRRECLAWWHPAFTGNGIKGTEGEIELGEWMLSTTHGSDAKEV